MKRYCIRCLALRETAKRWEPALLSHGTDYQLTDAGERAIWGVFTSRSKNGQPSEYLSKFSDI